MIHPTNGRVVLFTPSSSDPIAVQRDKDGKATPLAAIIAHVHGQRCINLSVLDANGMLHARQSVTLLQDDDAPIEFGYYAEWMSFQKGQAGKTEALEAKIAAGSPGVPAEELAAVAGVAAELRADRG